MKEHSEFLTERELFILEHHSAMSYKAIGLYLGISRERARQLKVCAERKIREEKRREQAEAIGQIPVTLTLRRNQLWVLIRGLEAHQSNLLRPDQRRNQANLEKDPDLELTKQLICTLTNILKSSS